MNSSARRLSHVFVTIVFAAAAAGELDAQAPRAKPAAPAPATKAAQPPATTPGGSIAACDYITPDEAKSLLGPDATPATAPSKAFFTSCGYSSPTGDAITVTVADYGLPLIAKQFFDKTRELLKSSLGEDVGGAPAFSYATTATGTPAPPTAAPVAKPATPTAAPTPAPAPPTSASALQAQTSPFNTMTFLALKDQRTVRLDASGAIVTLPQQLPKLRAIFTRVVSTLPPPPAPSPTQPVP